MDNLTTRALSKDASLRWLEACLVGLDSIAPVHAAPQLRKLLADVPDAARQLILVELIKCDMAAAADVGLRRGMDFYLSEFPDWLPPGEIPMDLVLEEMQLRREAGEDPDWEDYRRKYPGLASTMGRLLHVGEATARCGQRTPVPQLPLHETIDDFHILGLLGEGAFAQVYLARQESMQRLVALKATGHGSDEPQALSQLDHPNIVRVYDQRICTQRGLRLLYMQFVPGGTLADCIEWVRAADADVWSGKFIIESVDRHLVATGQNVPEGTTIRQALARQDWPTAVAWIGAQLAEGLNYAHSRGVLHRDIKPANILLTTDGVPKLADFNVSFSGIAGRAGAAVNFGGSLAYMSPEQLRAADPADATTAEQLDPQSDLFSLGVVLWEMYQGRRPWKVERAVRSWPEAIQSQLDVRQSPLPELSAKNAAGRVLDRTLRRVLSLEREERPKNGAELAGALRLALYPEVAERFYPSPGSWSQRLGSCPPLLLIVMIALIPNVAAALFNYVYNASHLMVDYPKLWTQFERLSLIVNSILFPLAIIITLYKIRPIVRAVRRGPDREPPTESEVAATWNIGRLIAQISGSLWVVAGLIFPIALLTIENTFRLADAARFMISLLISGGIAIAYPFFGLSLLVVLIYYPRLIRPTMADPEFPRRRSQMIRQCRWFLLLTALTPLLALALLVLQQESSKLMLLATIGTTALGLVLSFWASQSIDECMRQTAPVLAPQHFLPRD